LLVSSNSQNRSLALERRRRERGGAAVNEQKAAETKLPPPTDAANEGSTYIYAYRLLCLFSLAMLMRTATVTSILSRRLVSSTERVYVERGESLLSSCSGGGDEQGEHTLRARRRSARSYSSYRYRSTLLSSLRPSYRRGSTEEREEKTAQLFRYSPAARNCPQSCQSAVDDASNRAHLCSSRVAAARGAIP
jgi:hypothetical protein